ncbi:MAG: hypothetical protein WC117_01050 [Sphaerochaetaceae bacterium]
MSKTKPVTPDAVVEPGTLDGDLVVPVENDPETNPPEQKEKKPAHPARVDVIIHAQDGPGGKDDVTITVKGKSIDIHRGKRVSIPWAYYCVLRNAVQTDFYMNDKDQVVTEERERFPVSRMDAE